MKKILPVLLCAALLLGACTGGGTDTSLESDDAPSQPQQVLEVDEPEEEPEPEPQMTVEEAMALLVPEKDGAVPIADQEQLRALAALVNSGDESHHGVTYVMQSDLTLTDAPFWPIGGGEDAVSMPLFQGSFDGGNHVLYGLNITQATGNRNGTGLFGAVGEQGSVQGLHIVRGEVHGYNAVAGVAGYCAGSLYNCSFNGSVEAGGEGVGAIAGILEKNGSADSCFANAQVSGNSKVGGFAGHAKPGCTIQNCYALGQITAIDSPHTDQPVQIGGFIGSQDQALVQNCYASNSVLTAVASKVVGAFIGYNDGSPSGCYYNQTATENWQAVDANADTEEHQITGCTVEQLVEQATYVAWDFEKVWGIDDERNRGLPYLRAAWEDTEPSGEPESPPALEQPDTEAEAAVEEAQTE